MTIDEYAKAVAEAVRAHCEQEARDWDDRAGQAIGNVIAGIRLDAIIASVPKPEAQHHDAPTCDGWWWAHRAEADCWWLVHFEAEDDRVEPAQGFAAYEAADFDRWVGPLRSPDDAD